MKKSIFFFLTTVILCNFPMQPNLVDQSKSKIIIATSIAFAYAALTVGFAHAYRYCDIKNQGSTPQVQACIEQRIDKSTEIWAILMLIPFSLGLFHYMHSRQ